MVIKKKTIATVKKQELAHPSQSDGIMNSLTAAIESGKLTVEQLPIMLDAQERILDRQAREIYANDMSSCQGEIPTVLKNKYNPQTQSSFEDLESLNKAIKPVYTKWGFAVSFNTGKADEGWLKTIAKVTHRAGWSETFESDLPMDGMGIKGTVNKTGVHAVASSRSYARRYLLKDIFNLTTSEDIDDDGNAAGATFQAVLLINDKQIADLSSLIDEVGITEAEFLKVAKHESLSQIPADRFSAAVSMLERRRDAVK